MMPHTKLRAVNKPSRTCAEREGLNIETTTCSFRWFPEKTKGRWTDMAIHALNFRSKVTDCRKPSSRAALVCLALMVAISSAVITANAAEQLVGDTDQQQQGTNPEQKLLPSTFLNRVGLHASRAVGAYAAA